MPNRTESQPLALTDWAAYVEGISTDCETMLWELVLYALLRDDVLIQDEALAQSAKLADWFVTDDKAGVRFRVLEELIDTGVFVVVALEPGDYPVDPALDLQKLGRWPRFESLNNRRVPHVSRFSKRGIPRTYPS